MSNKYKKHKQKYIKTVKPITQKVSFRIILNRIFDMRWSYKKCLRSN